MSAYATATELKELAHLPAATADDAKFGTLLERASRMFDRMVGVADQFFDMTVVGEDTEPTEQIFYPNGTRFIKLPPYIAGELTDVEMPDGYTVPDYIERDGYLVITTSTGVLDPYAWWQEGVPVTVTAIWGYAATPPEIKQVIIEIAIKLWRGTDAAFAKTAALDVFVLELSPMAQNIVSKYRMRHTLAFA